MAAKTRGALQADFATLLPDNTTQAIRASSLRTALGNVADTIFREPAYLLEDSSGRILLEDAGGYLIIDESDAPVEPPPPYSSDLILWLDPADNSTMWQDSAKTTPVTALGDPIGYWADKSGNGNDFSQTDNARRPTWQGSYVRFQTDWLLGPDLSAYTSGTLGARVITTDSSASGAGAGSGGWFHFSSQNDTSSAAHWSYTSNTSGQMYFGFCSSVRPYLWNWDTAGRPAANSELVLITTKTSISLASYVNGSFIATATAGNGNLGSSPVIGGTRRASVIADWSVADGSLYGLALYDRVLAGAEVTELNNFLDGA